MVPAPGLLIKIILLTIEQCWDCIKHKPIFCCKIQKHLVFEMHGTNLVTTIRSRKIVCQMFCAAVLHPYCTSFNFFRISKEADFPSSRPIGTTLDGAQGTPISSTSTHFLDEITMIQRTRSEYQWRCYDHELR